MNPHKEVSIKNLSKEKATLIPTNTKHIIFHILANYILSEAR
tara:strand:- start:1269 stop:1394 length:126 start_codon:yes stop_codon:yes gene_type:complete